MREGVSTVARSSLAAIAGALLLGACATLPPPTPAPMVVAPAPKQYTCEQMRAAGRELDAIPPGAVLRTFINDYGAERRQLRAARGEPEPAGCSPTS